MFIPLRVISGYSFLQSGLTIEKIANSIAKENYNGASICDNGVLYAVPEFIHAIENIKKPYIFGTRFLVDNFSLCLYVINENGYKNICELSSKYEENFKIEDLQGLTDGLVAILETNHDRFKIDFANNSEHLTRNLNELSKGFTNFYLGIEITNKEEFEIAKKIREFASLYTYDLIAFPRIRYQKKEDAIALKIVEAIRDDIKLDIKKYEGQEYFFSKEEYQKIYSKKEIEETNNVLKMNAFSFHQKRGEMLHFPVKDSIQTLKNRTYDELKKLNLENETYLARLEKELDVIIKMGYPDYFLIVSDYVNYAKTHDILVGSGRGSAAGSLVSYLLGITEIDPLKYDLQFERFLNIGRKTMPDIDVDFVDTRRDDMVQYMRDKYGKEKVASIVTFQTILAKQALRDVGRIYDIPTNHIDLLSKRLTNKDYSLRDSYRCLKPFKELVDSDKYFLEIVTLASKIEGLPRQNGLHAAGIILNDFDIKEAMPIITDFNDNYISQYEMGYLEEQGFLKMDFLALRNLTVIQETLKLINENKKEKLNFENIPLDDEESYKLIASTLTMGIFQLESAGMRRAIKVLKPNCFNDVVALLALFRPGPMDNIQTFANRKLGKEKFNYLSSGLKDILSSTYGIIVYQEQINQIATVMAGFSLSEADMFRRAVSKKKKEELSSLEKSFIDGSIKNGYKYEEAKKIFDHINKFAEYGFNKSHSVGYSMIAVRMAYLKAHYPLEFYQTILTYGPSTDDVKFNDYVSELRKRNLEIRQPNINESSDHFVIKDNSLIFPLSAIHGINAQVVNSILEERKDGPFTDYFDFILRVRKYGITDVRLQKLINAGALDVFGHTRSTLRNNILSASQYAELVSDEQGNLSLIASQMPKPNLYEERDDKIEELNKEYEALGIMLSDNPLRYKKDLIMARKAIYINDLNENENATIVGIIKTKKVINTKKGQPMAFITVFDETGELSVVVFSRTYETCFSILEKNNIVVIKGTLRNDRDELSFVADQIELLEEE